MLGDEVKKARLSAGLSQASAAGRLGKTRSWLCRVEHGGIRLTVATARDLIHAIALDPSIVMTFLTTEEPPGAPAPTPAPGQAAPC